MNHLHLVFSRTLTLFMFFCVIFNLNGQVSFTGQSTALSTTIPAGDDRLLLVQIVTTDGEANTSVFWGTNSLTLLRGALTPDDEERLELWYYHAGSSTSDETASLTVANQASLSTSTFAGVNPTAPFVITPSPTAISSSGITQIFGGSTVGNLAYRATLVKTNVDVSQPAAQTEVCDILVPLDGSDHKNHATFKSVTTCPTDETGVSFGGNYSFVSMVARIQRIEADCNLTCGSNGTPNCYCTACDCDEGWSGPNCDECLIVCQNGTLDPLNCECDCTGNWTGSDCSDCSLLCENGGSADVHCEVCSCTGGWFGPNCNLCAIFVGSECQLDLATAIAAALATDNPINIILDVTTEAVTQIPASVTIMVPERVVWTHDSSLSNAGTVDNNGSVVILGSTVFTNTGTYKGTGTLEGQMINNGTIQIGQD